MSWTQERARVAALSRHGDRRGAEEARERLRLARAEDYIRKLVDQAPPLTEEQRSRLAALLRPDVGTAA